MSSSKPAVVSAGGPSSKGDGVETPRRRLAQEVEGSSARNLLEPETSFGLKLSLRCAAITPIAAHPLFPSGEEDTMAKVKTRSEKAFPSWKSPRPTEKEQVKNTVRKWQNGLTGNWGGVAIRKPY